MSIHIRCCAIEVTVVFLRLWGTKGVATERGRLRRRGWTWNIPVKDTAQVGKTLARIDKIEDEHKTTATAALHSDNLIVRYIQ